MEEIGLEEEAEKARKRHCSLWNLEISQAQYCLTLVRVVT